MKIINPEPGFVERKLKKKELIVLTVFQFVTVHRKSVTERGHQCLMRKMTKMSKRGKIIEHHA